MSEKFIIELEDEVNGLRKAKGFNTLVFDQNGVNKLTPYKEKREASNGRWEPENNNVYWFINNDGTISSVLWYNDEADRKFYVIGNCFRTREDAEFAVERLKVIAELKKYACSKEREYGDNNPIWFLRYDSRTDKITAGITYAIFTAGLYFKSIEDVEVAIAAVGENRLKKYYFEIK